MEIKDLVKNSEKYYGHIGGKNKEFETLQEHTKLCGQYYRKIKDFKNVNAVLKRIYKVLFKTDDYLNIFMELADSLVDFHDIGKINGKFQWERLNNNNFKTYDSSFDLGIKSEHSIVSSAIYFYYYGDKINNLKIDEQTKYLLTYFIILNSYVISRHHSPLNNFSYEGKNFISNFLEKKSPLMKALKKVSDLKILEDKFFADFDKKIEDILDLLYEMEDDLSFNKIRKDKNKIFYIYVKLMYSLLVAGDFYSTTNYIKGFKTKLENLQKDELIKIYNNSNLLESIRDKEKSGSYKKRQEINDLRTEIFLQVEKNFEKISKNEIGKNIYFLESPTGSGKSNIAMNLSFKMLKGNINKIFYVYPFNTLVEQNKNTLDKFYKGTEVQNNIAVINSLSPIGNKYQEKLMEEWEYYIKSLLDRQFLHSPFIVTSNVGFFNTLFSSNRESIFGLYQLIDSVIVLDEIQAYKEKIWNEIIEMLDAYAETLNFRIIIMSATLPDLSKLLEEKERNKVVKLIENPKKFFENKLFKNRVRLDYGLLDKGKIFYTDLINHMKDHVKNHKKILLEFIKRKDAEDFYKEINKNENFKEYEILILTGQDNLKTKNDVIEEIGKDKNIILVATQVIEAGVDIDMDIGYKDISKLENEEQFLGRINRSAHKKNSTAYFFDMADENKIYGHIDSELTLRNPERRTNLLDKDFSNYFEIKLEKSKERKESLSYDEFEGALTNNKFEKISKHMKLIDNDEKIEVFLAQKIKCKKENNGSKTEERKIDGRKIWKEYCSLLENNEMDYSEKIVKLSDLKLDMSYFLYKVTKMEFEKYFGQYNEHRGNIFYIEDGEAYLENGRLNLNFCGDFL